MPLAGAYNFHPQSLPRRYGTPSTVLTKLLNLAARSCSIPANAEVVHPRDTRHMGTYRLDGIPLLVTVDPPPGIASTRIAHVRIDYVHFTTRFRRVAWTHPLGGKHLVLSYLGPPADQRPQRPPLLTERASGDLGARSVARQLTLADPNEFTLLQVALVST